MAIRRPKRKPSAKPAKLTIEEAREQFELGSVERLVAEIEHYAEFDEIARLNTNAKNRAKTQVGKSFKQRILQEEMQPGDRILIGDKAFFYDYASSESIDPEELHKLWQDGDISREVFFKCINVTKERATALIGGHLLDPITKRTIGKSLDVRKEELDKPIDEPFKIEHKKQKPGRVKKTQQNPLPRKTATSGRKPIRRRIRAKR